MVLVWGVKNRAADKDQGKGKLALFSKVCSVVQWSSFGNKECFINVFHLLGVYFCRRTQRYCHLYSLRRDQDPTPKAALLFLDFSSRVSASPPFPDQQLFEPALWTPGKSETEVYSLKASNGGHRKSGVPRSPIGHQLSYSIIICVCTYIFILCILYLYMFTCILLQNYMYLEFFLFLFSFLTFQGCTHGMQKFPGQGSDS